MSDWSSYLCSADLAGNFYIHVILHLYHKWMLHISAHVKIGLSGQFNHPKPFDIPRAVTNTRLGIEPDLGSIWQFKTVNPSPRSGKFMKHRRSRSITA